MNILMLSIDSKFFEENSAVRTRLIAYAAFAPDFVFHIIVHTKPGYREEKVSENVILYPTNTHLRPLYFIDGFLIGAKILKGRGRSFLITSQEAMTNLLGVFLKTFFRTKLEVQIHTDFFSRYFVRESFVNFLRFIGYCIGIHFADGIRVVSQRAKESLHLILHIPYTKIHILPIFVDVRALQEQQSSFNLREKYPQFEKIILMIGRLTREKNYPLAFDILNRLLRTHPKTGLIIVGDGKEQSRLELMPHDLGLGTQIIFEGHQNDILSYLKGADVFLHTSNYEGYGLVFIEAAAAGTPIVSTDVGIMNDVFIDGESALVCPVGDTDCLSGKIQKLFEDTALRKKLIMGAATALSKHTYSSREEYLQKYKESWEKVFNR